MVRRNIILSARRRQQASATIAYAAIAYALTFASVADAQPITWPIDAADGPAMWIHRVAETEHHAGPGDFADLAERVQPAVIAVASNGAAASNNPPGQSFEFGPPDRQREAPDAPDQAKPPAALEAVTIGSGFFISADGYAVTDSHIVEDSDTAVVRTSDNKTYPAKVVGKDSLSGVALIKVDGRSDFQYAELADQPPRIGDWILAAGNSLGLGSAVTAGIVSGQEREIEKGSAQGFIQIDAPVNQGDSGGPTFNTKGEVIGVNSFIFSPSGGSTGIAFAIPADTVKTVVPQLKDKGTVTRGWMGADVQSVTSDIADSLGMKSVGGAIVARLEGNGPAAKAGLKSGDVITAVGGEPIRSASELTKKIQAAAPGSSVKLAMLRQGQEGSLDVRVGQLPEQSRAPSGR